LQQLCKHFADKVPVTFTPEKPKITLAFGPSVLRVEGGVLTLSVTSNDNTGLAKLEPVMGGHFARFAYRETLVPTWMRSA
jgi:hypothetical protein